MHFKQISIESYCIAAILDCDIYLKVQLIFPYTTLKSQQDSRNFVFHTRLNAPFCPSLSLIFSQSSCFLQFLSYSFHLYFFYEIQVTLAKIYN